MSTRIPTRRRLARAACTLVLVAAACDGDRATAPVALATASPPPAGADAAPTAVTMLAWNALTRTLVERNQPNQQAALRAFAYATHAAHEAAATLDVAMRGVATDAHGRQTLVRAAIATAAAEVLRELFPRDAALVDASLAGQLAALRAGEAPAVHPDDGSGRIAADPMPQGADRVAEAERIGASAGQAALARARGDGFDAVWTGSVPTGTGIWASALTPPRPPLLPLLGKARTFFLTSGSQFRPAPPPAIGSPAFEAGLREVRQISDTRTPEQQRIAERWAGATGSLVAGYWNAVADSLIARDHLTEARAAHLLALVNMAAWDANVACHDAKYTYWLARPTQMDPKITLAIGLPNHPSYPSNHACLSGTVAEILGAAFPADAAALRARAQEAMVSRVYAGLHYRFDGEAGLEIARRVAALALTEDAATRGRIVPR